MSLCGFCLRPSARPLTPPPLSTEKYAQHWCSQLTDPQGPFAGCHGAVNPSSYYSVTAHRLCPPATQPPSGGLGWSSMVLRAVAAGSGASRLLVSIRLVPLYSFFPSLPHHTLAVCPVPPALHQAWGQTPSI